MIVPFSSSHKLCFDLAEVDPSRVVLEGDLKDEIYADFVVSIAVFCSVVAWTLL